MYNGFEGKVVLDLGTGTVSEAGQQIELVPVMVNDGCLRCWIWQPPSQLKPSYCQQQPA
jgi:hypothetical protein